MKPSTRAAPTGRVLGVDLGERRIGLARSDELGMLASEFQVLARATPKEDATHLRAIIKEHAIVRVVVGLPTSMRGEIGWQAQRTQTWVDAVRAALGVPTTYWDERLTTVEAERAMQFAGIRAKHRRERIDMTAAAVMLQSYLDYQRRASHA